MSLLAQFDVVGSVDYGRIFGVNYDRTTESKLYSITMSNHILSSEDNGQTWSIFYAVPNGSFNSLQKNLKKFQDDKLTYHVSASSISDNRSVFMLNINTKQIEHQYTPPMPDPSASDNWVKSYNILESNPDYALISVGFSIGLNNFEKTFYTADGGSNWSQVYYTVDNFNIFPEEVAIDPENPEKLFITLGNGNTDVDGGLLISNDGGQNWTEKIEGVVLSPIAFHPENSDEIWVGTGIFGSTPENLYKSTDGGDSWEIVPITWTDYLLDNINVIQFNPSDPDNILVLEDNEVLISEDGGTTWDIHVYESASDNPDHYYYGLDASFNPFAENEVFISANYYPMFSTDKGATMERIKTPFFHSEGNMFYVSNDSQEHLYYGVQFGFVHKDIQTGDVDSYNILPINYVTNNSGTTLIADPDQVGRVYVFSGGFMGYNLKVSDDHGETQTDLYSIFSNSLDDVEAIPGATDKIWASFSSFGENPEIYEINFSDLNNVQTSSISLPSSPGIVSDILFSNDDAQHVMIVKGSHIHESIDGGATWTEISNGLDALSPDADMIFKIVQNPLDAQQLSIASSKGIFTSTDGGQNWVQLTTSIVFNVEHSIVHEGHILAATHNSNVSEFSLTYSKDGGETWEMIEDELFFPIKSTNSFSSTDFHFYDDFADIYIATSGLGVLKYTLDLTTLSVSDPEIISSDLTTIYPNPATDFANIASKEEIKQVEIFNMAGQKVINSASDRISVSHLSKGIYIAKITLENGKTETRKLVKD